MSRGKIVGFVLLTVGGLAVSSGWAQEEQSRGASLVDRIASLRDVFRRDDSPKKQSASRESRNSRQRRATKQRPGNPSSGQQPTRTDSGQSMTLPRIQASELLPGGMFSRKATDDDSANRNRPARVARAASSPRAGSASSGNQSKKSSPTSRNSPTIKRQNELEAALADLLPAADPDAMDQALSDVLGGPLLNTRSRNGAAKRKTLDLRAALLADDVGEAIAEEAAKSAAPDEAADDELGNADVVSESETTLVTEPQEADSVTAPVVDPFERAAEEAFGEPEQEPNFVEDSPRSVAIRQESAPVNSVLQSQQQPVIVSHVEGPRSILVGREASYQVILENTSHIAAGEISASIRVPHWAEIVDAMSTSGVVQRDGDGNDPGALQWRLHTLDAGSSQSLRLRLIPRSGRPLQLGVQWSQAPVSSQTLVEVQEPKLAMSIGGPDEVLFGKPERFRIALRNPGTGVAENVSIRLVPPGGDPEKASVQAIGDLRPGELREIEVELTPREAGELIMQAAATAEGGLETEVVKSVLCRKPELEVDWRGPEKKYAGTVAAYYFRVRNSGTATTEPVEFTVQLPRGASFVAASDGHVHNSQSGILRWQLGGVGAKQEQFIQLRCKVTQPGDNRFEITAQTEAGDLRHSKVFQTNVVALADLKLAVSDPQGPVPVGESVTYEIRVVNRGSTAAEGVSIVGLFSEGIDPTSVEGAQYTVRDGRVTFHPIKTLSAGREIVLRIRAEASQIGTHIFRAEVVCEDLDIKLAAEETTRFFKDEYRWEDGPTAYSAERNEAVNR